MRADHEAFARPAQVARALGHEQKSQQEQESSAEPDERVHGISPRAIGLNAGLVYSAACAIACWRNFGNTSSARSRIDVCSRSRLWPLQSRPVISSVPNGPTSSRKAISLSRKVLGDP